MRRILLALTVVLSSSAFLINYAFSEMPQAKGTVVIGEKPTYIKGNQAVTLLPTDLNMSQAQLLSKAYEIAKADGHKDPELVQGIILQESEAGRATAYRVAGSKSEPYYGVGQVKLDATRDVMSAYPAMWTKYRFQTKTDDELKAYLILNNVFNMEVTSKYLRILEVRYGLSGRDLLNAYQKGPGGYKEVDPDEYHYARGVEDKLARMKRR
jgi:hypothetical protein